MGGMSKLMDKILAAQNPKHIKTSEGIERI
jgi:hypothetical protein